MRIADTETNNTFVLDPNTVTQYGQLTYTMPATGNNKPSKLYRFEHGANQGLVRGYANSGQVFDWYGISDLNYITMYMPGQFFEAYWNTNKSKWSIWNHNIFMPIGYQNRSEYRNVHIGNGVTYDTKSSGIDFTGMVISWSDGSNTCTAVVVYDSGGTGTSGILYFYNISGGLNIFPNNNTITASDGTTALVNEATGTNKNVDYNIYHGFGLNEIDIKKEWRLSSDGTPNNSYNVLFGSIVTGARGNTIFQDSINDFHFQTNGGGIPFTQDSGVAVDLTTADYYINQKLIF